MTIRLAIAGVGNCASSLVQGLEYYENADPNAPAGEWYVREGTIWRTDHPVVQKFPEWFVDLGSGQTAAPYFPPRETAA